MRQPHSSSYWRNKIAYLCIFFEFVVFVSIVTLTIELWIRNNQMKSILDALNRRSRRYNSFESESNGSQEHLSELANIIYFKDGCDVSPYWANFGYCDDSTNIAECDYDNGDCCFPLIHQEFCTDCICHIDGKRHGNIESSKTFECIEELKDDNICQDEVNFYACGFDLKDCCREKIWCQDGNDCVCHFDGSRHPSIIADHCFAPLVGNGICNDEVNTEECNFDGNDCCLHIINNFGCTECLCHLDHKSHESTCHIRKLGDGICHDECSLLDRVQFDKFDCCQNYIDDSVCTDCICITDLSRKPSIKDLTCEIKFIGDGACHDSCNTEEFQFDNGDCCLSKIDRGFCIDCTCHMDGMVHQEYSCNAQLVGNQICQDDCNSLEFDYDGLDCCLEFINTWLCHDCICSLDGSMHPNGVWGNCYGWHLGDGICNDGCNEENLEYDRGDCCLPAVNAILCEECYCHQDQSVHPSHVCRPQLIGDRVCHEPCNQEMTQFDGGDCCLPLIVNFYCSKCICHAKQKTHFSRFCLNEFMIGDGICDDGCNGENYNFDSGDCCLTTIIDLNCQHCLCIANNEENSNESEGPKLCLDPMIGDGKCHDVCNTHHHDYDGLDCCLEVINSRMCSQCLCHLDNSHHRHLDECVPLLIADGNCDDECNFMDHAFDGGDCCATQELSRLKCSACQCHKLITNDMFVSLQTSFGCNVLTVGDLLCNDMCNTAEFAYDYGDCCYTLIDSTGCDTCLCHIDQERKRSYNCHLKFPSNGICNHECNNLAEDFDGFDCCLTHILVEDIYCTECVKNPANIYLTRCHMCKCHLDNSYHQLFCPQEDQGNGQCEDFCNTLEFDFDGGDCCLEYIDDLKCIECACHLDGTKHLPHCAPRNRGTGYCTDSCNSWNFHYDEMECCLEAINDEECIDCICYLDGLKHPTTDCTLAMVQDDICHKECNVEEYDYDSGACCMPLVNAINCYGNCFCHKTLLFALESCQNTDWIGDQNCDAGCSHKVYNFDGLDCYFDQ